MIQLILILYLIFHRNLSSLIDPDKHFMYEKGECNFLHFLQVEHTNKMFEIMKDKPPRNKFEPPVAGAITWTQFILRRLRNTITSFLKIPEICEAEHMKTVSIVTKIIKLHIYISIYNFIYMYIVCVCIISSFGAFYLGYGQV